MAYKERILTICGSRLPLTVIELLREQGAEGCLQRFRISLLSAEGAAATNLNMNLHAAGQSWAVRLRADHDRPLGL